MLLTSSYFYVSITVDIKNRKELVVQISNAKIVQNIMDINKFYRQNGEKPLDNIVANGGFCASFRTISCIGDSLSSGEFESMENGLKGYHDMFEYSWGQYIARDAGCTVFNMSRGGMTAKEFVESFARLNGFYEDKYKSQAYIIALGVNDITQMLNGSLEFGDISDVDLSDCAKNKPTFVGYYAKIIAKFHEIQPKAKFFLMTIPREDQDAKRLELEDRHSKLLHELANMFENCYVLDFRKYAPVYDNEFKANFYLGGHLNASGYRLTALMVESYIDYIMRNNAEDFLQVGFIGTPFHNTVAKW